MATEFCEVLDAPETAGVDAAMFPEAGAGAATFPVGSGAVTAFPPDDVGAALLTPAEPAGVEEADGAAGRTAPAVAEGVAAVNGDGGGSLILK